MEDNYEKQINYQAAELALSIALCESGSSETRQTGLTTYRTTHTIYMDKEVLLSILPVLLKYVDKDSIENCLKNAKEIAMARKVRGWFWWLCASFFGSIIFGFIHISMLFIAFFAFVLIDTIIFTSRKRVGKIWRKVQFDNEKRAIGFEQMIKECKKSRIKLCLEYFKNTK